MKKLLLFSLKLTLISLGLYGLHSYVVLEQWPATAAMQSLIPGNYIFLFILHLVSFAIIWSVWRKHPDKAGFAFLGLSLLKIMIAVAFLYSPLLKYPSQQESIVAHFIAPYMLLLFYEVFEVYQLIKNRSSAENKKHSS